MQSDVASYWNIPPQRGTLLIERPDLTLVVDDTLPENRRALHLVEPSGTHRFAVRPEIASAAGLHAGEHVEPDAIAAAIESVGEAFHPWEQVFYLPGPARQTLTEAPALRGVRELVPADADAFAAFNDANSAEDIEEAFVELDHWLVVGAVEARHGGEWLQAVSSVYPWDGSRLADIGVLVEPGSRGKGLAVAVVQAAAAATLARGYEPQYRCQLSNVGSRATALRAGFQLFGTWRVVNGEPPEPSMGAVH